MAERSAIALVALEVRNAKTADHQEASRTRHGHWGKFGGRYVPETLVAPLDELTKEFTRARHDADFWRELDQLLRDYCGRPTPLFHARRLTAHAAAERKST